jgi:uncharacterized protein YecT (DUF1311 family)
MLLGMKKLWFILPLALASAATLFAQSRDTEAQIKAKCEKYLLTPLPAEATAVAAPKKWPECDSYKSYSGIGTKVDYVAARRCAWAERLAFQADLEPRYTVASIVGGSAMLSVLFANGEGVEQNLLLAGRFACEAGIGHGLKDIEAVPSNPIQAGKKFKYCGEAYTTFEMNYCAAYDSEIAAQKREDVLASFSSRWPKDQQEAFKLLEHVKENYVEAHGRGETYMGGTIRALRENGVEERQRDKFLAAVQAFEGGHLPHGSASDYAKADAALNLLYRKAVAVAEAHKLEDEGAIQPEGIRNAERAWLKYRDEWVAFAKLHYPATDSNTWLTLLTTNRAASLRMTLCGIDSKDSSCPRERDK